MSVRRSVLAGHRFDSTLQGVPPGEDVDLSTRLSEHAKLVITPRARLINLMSSTGRRRPHWLQADAQANHYLYRRNWQRGVRNRLAFAWLHLGYALLATAASVRRTSFGPWHALLAGIRSGQGQND
jgi:GT2 family glycosyltransferase